MIQLNIDGNAQDVSPKQYTPEQLTRELKTNYDYTLFSCGQDRTGYTASEVITVRHIKAWKNEWYTIEKLDTNEAISVTDITNATRLLNEFLREA